MDTMAEGFYRKFTNEQLRMLARAKGIDPYDMNRCEVIRALENASSEKFSKTWDGIAGSGPKGV